MDTGTAWFLVAGALLLSVALLGSYVRRLPLSTTMLYLAVGYALGAVLVTLLRQADALSGGPGAPAAG